MTMDETTIMYRNAGAGDLAGVLDLLRKESLPTGGVPEHFSTFLVAEQGQRTVGAIGLEIYGETALLRSAVVAPEFRNAGIGSGLFSRALQLATERDVHRVVLLTETAEEYFRRKGFAKIDAAGVRGPVTSSVEFSGACPSTAVCMELTL
jgi:N-acetylglutamate synthase-like GNAT family acetyltransferase